MLILRAIIAASFLALLLMSCDKTLDFKLGQDVSYEIKGNSQSELYPVELKRDGEDVRIRMKNSTPMPEIFSIDVSGGIQPFNFKTDGDALIVPGKFDHISLRHQGVDSVEIIRKNAP
jgi:type IV secretory pathway VirB9-like protein